MKAGMANREGVFKADRLMLLIFFRLAPGSEPLDLASLVIIRFLGVPRYAVCYFHRDSPSLCCGSDRDGREQEVEPNRQGELEAGEKHGIHENLPCVIEVEL